MSAETAERFADRRGRASGWFFVALGAWVVLVAATLATATSIPVRWDVVVGLLGVVAIIAGAVTGRWLVAGLLATIWFTAAVVLSVAVSRGDVSLTYDDDPAGAWGVRAIWIAATLVWSAVMALAVALKRAAPSPGEIPRATRLALSKQQHGIERQVDQLAQRVSAVEELLRSP